VKNLKPAWYVRAYDRIGNVSAIEVIVVLAIAVAVMPLVVAVMW